MAFFGPLGGVPVEYAPINQSTKTTRSGHMSVTYRAPTHELIVIESEQQYEHQPGSEIQGTMYMGTTHRVSEVRPLWNLSDVMKDVKESQTEGEDKRVSAHYMYDGDDGTHSTYKIYKVPIGMYHVGDELSAETPPFRPEDTDISEIEKIYDPESDSDD